MTEIAEVKVQGAFLLSDELKASLRQLGHGLEVQGGRKALCGFFA